jgi:hypothetical protein
MLLEDKHRGLGYRIDKNGISSSLHIHRISFHNGPRLLQR